MIVPDFEASFPVVVPASAHTLTGFRAWAASEDFPEHGKISLIVGELLIDMSPERIESHNQAKKEVTRVIDTLARECDSGKVYADGVWVTTEEAELSTEPDAAYARWESLESGRVQVVAVDDESDGIELRGSPDWTLEVIRRSSVRKDTRLLPVAYYRAGVEEYWLIDARDEDVKFTVFVRGESGFRAVQPRHGWLESRVFGRAFHLDRERDRAGGWCYTLHVRPTTQEA